MIGLVFGLLDIEGGGIITRDDVVSSGGGAGGGIRGKGRTELEEPSFEAGSADVVPATSG